MFGCFLIMSQLFRGTQREILRKRPKNNKAWINLSETILSILGDCWEIFICSSLPARLMEEFPASKVLLQPATWLTRKFPSRRMSTYYWAIWVWTWDKIVGGVGGGGGGDSSYSGHQINLYTLNCPSDTFLPRTYYFFQISQPTKICLKNRYFEEEIHWVPLTFSWRRGGPSNLARTKGGGSIKGRQALVNCALCIMV